MPRKARIVMVGMPHHVTQRGNYRQKVFESHQDYQKYCYWAKEYAFNYNIEILSYCLMTNHVHFIVVPRSEDGLARFFNTLHMRYSQHKNSDKKQKGHLWQGRFYSSILDEGHLLRAIRYVERNPLRANIVQKIEDYVWSSARERLGLEQDAILKTVPTESVLGGSYSIDWKEFLKHGDEQMTDLMRQKTQKGHAIGAEKFVIQLESRFGVSLKDGRVGRPAKK